MKIEIQLTAREETQLAEVAQRNGLSPEEWLRQLALESLTNAPINDQDELDGKLRRWQAQDGVKLNPNIPASELFARWAEEDARMTEEERNAEGRLWEDIERGLAENRRTLRLKSVDT
jgi:hypothetical protein